MDALLPMTATTVAPESGTSDGSASRPPLSEEFEFIPVMDMRHAVAGKASVEHYDGRACQRMTVSLQHAK